MQEYTIDFSLQAFPTLDLVPFILPNLRTPTLAIVLQHRFKVLQQKFPLPTCILTSICHSALQLGPLLFSPSFKHQPLITILIFNYYYSAKSLPQQNSSMTSLNKKKNTRKKPGTLLLHSFFYLTFPINYANLFSMQLLPPPSIVRRSSYFS